MKIGIYTIHACNNFGAVLQAYATTFFLNSYGFQSELVNILSAKDEKSLNYNGSAKGLKGILLNIYASLSPKVRRKAASFASFRKLLPLSKRYYSYEEVMKNPPQYDVHIVGSDQVWNVENGFGNAFFFLPFLPDGSRKISFSSSFGNLQAARKNKKDISQLLSSFYNRSVREFNASVFLTDECQLPTANVLDPTFLLDTKQWADIAGTEPLIKGGYILYYGFDTNKTCGEAIELLRNQLNMPVVGISVTLHTPYKYDLFYQEAGPKEFLNLIKNASFVITSSFHGMALSINFRKDFVVLRHGTRMSRMESLLASFDLSQRIVSSTDDLLSLIQSCKTVDYQSREKKISEMIKNTQNWLLSSIK